MHAYRLTVQQLHGAIAELDQAIYSHEQWQRNVVRDLVCRLPPDPSDLAADAHELCRFGQWYVDGVRPLRDHPAFRAIGEAHRQMHESAARLLQRSVDGLEITVGEYDQFTNLLDRLRLEIQSMRSELSELAQSRDVLTGARNRVGLLAELREQQALVRRGKQHCAIAMVDLDHFKDVNDSHGHSVGDAALKATAESLRRELRSYDHLFRYGGEEFLVVMPETELEGASELAERLRAAVAEQSIDGDGVRLTASFGVAVLDPEHPVEESIDRADKALYRAKRAGRNRVEIAA